LKAGNFSDPSYLVIEFKNVSSDSIRILRPVGRSEWPLFSIEPNYEMSFVDESGVALPEKGHGKMVGPFEGTTWPEDYYVDLSPDESAGIKVYISARIPKDGKYSVRRKDRYSGVKAKRAHSLKEMPPAGVWKGEVISKEDTATAP
jgi:hypothetical protein